MKTNLIDRIEETTIQMHEPHDGYSRTPTAHERRLVLGVVLGLILAIALAGRFFGGGHEGQKTPKAPKTSKAPLASTETGR